jgi:hypothetical protein
MEKLQRSVLRLAALPLLWHAAHKQTNRNQGDIRMNEDQRAIEDILFEVLENQMEDNHPKQVKETLMRLCMTGHSREDAMELMACALAPEMEAVVERQEAFNLQRYIEHLALLPEMPWVKDL